MGPPSRRHNIVKKGGYKWTLIKRGLGWHFKGSHSSKAENVRRAGWGKPGEAH